MKNIIILIGAILYVFNWAPSPSSDVVGYKLYENNANPKDCGNVTSCSRTVPEGLNQYNVTAYDAAGNESDLSPALFILNGNVSIIGN